ncbi:Pls/PosA family non-ribosomal peptide synthetase [Nocardioides acrostichi]|uniref:Pls/PosA family non-ribosomal peptide synthetase n=1 Tax=Nocardioides acrostichi TaxID=2784339 RepID=UPI002E29584F|nr:Pls/PosA family non-ribosomal peptide synthetase [Nocardioides acrostichi]
MSPSATPLPTLMRGEHAPAPRTLLDAFRVSVATHPDATALDSGTEQLTYAELAEAAEDVADELARLGVGRGDRVGVRAPSGTTELYVAILGVLHAGAAYVPVDADDPDERARVVFGEAEVAAVVGAGLALDVRPGPDGALRAPREREEPGPGDDAWIIFTSGSTGKPKGVAVTHRNAAAFVDAESRLFLTHDPIGPHDRVMAGLSVAFDASCEEMWLAWRHGATLVPAPRALVKSGMDVGPWLVANGVTIVSTVPTLVSLWPDEALERVRMLILGGEAVPPGLAPRLCREGREVWNTYGPTEATVVACAAQLDVEGPVRIGLPLDGWDLAVVDADGQPVPEGETGELIIGGVGLARYLDPEKDAEKYAPMPSLGWERAYRSGDLVENDSVGLLFSGRADDQVKVGGRRIELGEIDSALLGLTGVVGAAAAVRRTEAGTSLLVGYVTTTEAFDQAAALARLRADLPAALVPRLAVVDDIATRTSGKVDREALPWPLERTDPAASGLAGTAAMIAELWQQVLGTAPEALDDDFFDLGGGSLGAAQLVTRLRRTHPDLAVGDVYDHSRLGAMAAYVDSLAAGADNVLDREIRPTPLKTQAGQVAALVGVRMLAAPGRLTWLAVGANLAHGVVPWVPTTPWWVLAVAALVFLSPPGRMLLAAALARFVLRGVEVGRYPRGGKVHLRVWLAERSVEQLGATNLSGAALMTWYARLLGARVSRDVDLHSLPPVTGHLRLGRGCAIEPEVDLTGHWIDGDVLHLGEVRVGRRARVGTRSTLCPGAVLGDDSEVAPGSAVFGEVPEGEFWSGAPARRISKGARGPWAERPTGGRLWSLGYALAAVVVSVLPAVAVLLGVATALALADLGDTTGARSTLVALWPWLVPATLVGWVVLALLVLGVVRLAGLAVEPGVHAVRSAPALATWTTVRVLDEARTWLFPLYSSTLTPLWLRALGARVGDDVEASTVLMIPTLTRVADQAFLADDTLIGGYELGGGWLRAEHVKIGKRSFVGNSGMAAPGRKVPKRALVAVLSAAPNRKTARKGDSWLGSPPSALRRTSEAGDDSRTFAPPPRLRVARACWEAARSVPVTFGVLLHVLVGLLALQAWDDARDAAGPVAGAVLAVVLLGLLLVAAGVVAAALAVAAKWLLVGRHRVGSHPLWSSFVWRNELADTFVEVLAAPWFAHAAAGSPALVAWLRAMGARIGRGVWCESYWLPETDLIELGDGAVVNAGTVVQTHLFHDRVLACDRVRIRRGGTLGPNSVVLPAASIGRHATVGPVSLVMRGESVPDKTVWIGNPIGPWTVGYHQ